MPPTLNQKRYCGGPWCHLLGANGTDPGKKFGARLRGSVRRVYDADTKGYVWAIDGGATTRLCMGDALAISHTRLVLQILLPPGDQRAFVIELTLTDTLGSKRRALLSTAFFSAALTPLHAQVPLGPALVSCRGRWTNWYIDLIQVAQTSFGCEFHTLDAIAIGPTCKLRAIITLREDATIPIACQFGSSILPHEALFPLPKDETETLHLVGRACAGDDTSKKPSDQSKKPHIAFGSRRSKPPATTPTISAKTTPRQDQSSNSPTPTPKTSSETTADHKKDLRNMVSVATSAAFAGIELPSPPTISHRNVNEGLTTIKSPLSEPPSPPLDYHSAVSSMLESPRKDEPSLHPKCIETQLNLKAIESQAPNISFSSFKLPAPHSFKAQSTKNEDITGLLSPDFEEMSQSQGAQSEFVSESASVLMRSAAEIVPPTGNKAQTPTTAMPRTSFSSVQKSINKSIQQVFRENPAGGPSRVLSVSPKISPTSRNEASQVYSSQSKERPPSYTEVMSQDTGIAPPEAGTSPDTKTNRRKRCERSSSASTIHFHTGPNARPKTAAEPRISERPNTSSHRPNTTGRKEERRENFLVTSVKDTDILDKTRELLVSLSMSGEEFLFKTDEKQSRTDLYAAPPPTANEDSIEYRNLLQPRSSTAPSHCEKKPSPARCRTAGAVRPIEIEFSYRQYGGPSSPAPKSSSSPARQSRSKFMKEALTSSVSVRSASPQSLADMPAPTRASSVIPTCLSVTTDNSIIRQSVASVSPPAASLSQLPEEASVSSCRMAKSLKLPDTDEAAMLFELKLSELAAMEDAFRSEFGTLDSVEGGFSSPSASSCT